TDEPAALRVPLTQRARDTPGPSDGSHFPQEAFSGIKTGSDPSVSQSPALGGGVLAVDKLFFQSIGGSDPGLMLRGAEQIQLSIRVWSCGGSLEVVPCSRVAHLAPPPPPTPPDPQLLERDKIRLADTWMDAETPDVTEQAELKKSLRCKDFHWFLSTVYPQLYIPQDRPGLSGELYHVGTGYCADAPGERTLPGAILEVAPCSGTGKQHWELNSQGEVRWGPSGGLCLDPRGERVILSACPSRQPTLSRLQWRFLKLSGQLIHLESQLCLEAQREGGASQRGGVASQRGGVASQREGGASQRGGGGGLSLRPCLRHPSQQWHFEQLVAP
ncbi:hypothetical protein NHX12_023393, partial [Muraenolepis orangiensis]